MRSSIINVIIVVAVACTLALNDVPLGMSLLVGCAAGCFFMLWDIKGILAQQTQ